MKSPSSNQRRAAAGEPHWSLRWPARKLACWVSEGQGQGPGFHGDSTPHKCSQPTRAGDLFCCYPWNMGRGPCKPELASGTALELSAWGRALGGRRGSEAPKPFLLESTTEKGRAPSELARYRLPTAEDLDSWTLQWPGFPGNTPPWGGSLSSLGTSDLGPRRVRAAGSPRLGCFLACG